MNYITLFGSAVAYAVLAFLFMWLAKKVADTRVADEFDANYEIEENSNLALALRRGGLYLGIAIGMLGALSGTSTGFLKNVQELLIDGALVTGFIFVAFYINNWVIVHGLDNDEAVRNRNKAVGVVELGSYVATGLIAYGSFTGEGGGIWSAVAFFALGQVALLIIVALYELITPFDVINNVRDGNTAAGLMLAGMIVALAFVINASVTGDFRGWSQDLTSFGVSAGMGIFLLLLFTWPIDKLFLPGTTIRKEIERDKNVAAIAVTVGVRLALALVIGAIIV